MRKCKEVTERIEALETKLDAALARPTTVHKHEHHHDADDYYESDTDGGEQAVHDALAVVYVAIERAWLVAAPPGERNCDWERSQEEPWVSIADALDSAWEGERVTPRQPAPLSLARRRVA